MNELPRRIILQRLGVLFAATVAAGCGGGQDSAPSPAPTPPPSSTTPVPTPSPPPPTPAPPTSPSPPSPPPPSPPSPSIRKTFAYVAGVGSGDIAGFEIVDAATGALRSLGARFSSQGNVPREMVADAAGRRLYVCNRDSSNIGVFAIDAVTGVLSPIPGSPFAIVDAPFGLALHPDGRTAVVSSVADNAVFLLHLDAVTGAPSVAAGPFAAGTAPGQVLIDASGTTAFVANQSSRNVSAYTIDVANARLIPVAGSPFGSGGDWVYQLALHPAGTMLFASNYDSASVAAFRVEAGGVLVRVAGAPAAVEAQPYGLFVEPAGAYLYVASGGSGRIQAFRIDNNTRTIAPSGSPFDSGGTHGLALDPSGRVAFASDFGEDIVTTLTAAGPGQLVQHEHWPTGAQPLTIGFAVTTS
jgi:6-phosphogluconolactonase (cycloisomerase 2 family)